MNAIDAAARVRIADGKRQARGAAAGARQHVTSSLYSPTRGGGIGTSAIEQIGHVPAARRPDVGMHRTPERVGPIGVAHDLDDGAATAA